jgi:hypothetical protein
MRALLVISITLVGLMTLGLPTHADPYRWCAAYGGDEGGGGSNCYFMTLEQCRAAISGNGGFCNPNNFYDGRPVMTPDGGARPPPKRPSR